MATFINSAFVVLFVNNILYVDEKPIPFYKIDGTANQIFI